MNFSDHLWSQSFPIYQAIVAHPFNRELASGKLCPETFKFYMEQDAYYLIEFSKALAIMAGRAPSVSMNHTLLNFSQGALIAERELHKHFISNDYDPEALALSPANLAYTKHLNATAASASLEESMAAVLPCFWIYREVGRVVLESSLEDNPYALWISTYSCQEFYDGTEKAIALLNEMADHAPQKSKQLMEKAFHYSTLYEWHFWNDAYHQKTFKESIYSFA